MKKHLFLLMVTFSLMSCASKTVIFELSAIPPIQVSCAYEAINSMGEYDFVKANENGISFANKSVKGSLYHGGSASFGNFGIELSASPLLGPNLKEVSDKMVNRIYLKCRKNA